MALLTFIGDIGTGDETSANDKLIFKIYNNGVLFHTTGDALTDPNVSLNGAEVTIINIVASADSYSFSLAATDEAGNEQNTKSNEQIITILAVTGFPILSNFRIEDAEKSRIIFDASADITGMTKTGFIISGFLNSDLSLTIDGDGLGGYFTVPTPFTFWDNNTIRLGEITDTTHRQSILYNFLLEDITNNIIEPTSSTFKWASLLGAGAKTGVDAANSWDFTQLLSGAVAGMTIHLKAESYGDKSLTTLANGTQENPIKIIGYKTIADDIVSNYYVYGGRLTMNNLDSSEMPLFDGIGTFLELDSKVGLIIRNIQVQNYTSSIYCSGSASATDIIIDRVNTRNNSSQGIVFAGGTVGSTRNRIIDSNIMDAASVNIRLKGNHGLLKNVNSYCTRGGSGTEALATDYYMHIQGSNNICLNSKVYRDVDNTVALHLGHGIQVKAETITASYYNLIKGGTAINIYEGIGVRDEGAKYNVFKECEVYGEYAHTVGSNRKGVGGIDFFNGGQYNAFERNYIHDVDSGINFQWTTDNIELDISRNNTIRNNIFSNARTMFRVSNSYANNDMGVNDNYIYNNTFYDADDLFYIYDYNTVTDSAPIDLSSNLLKNNIIHSITGNENDYLGTKDYYTLGWAFDYCNFYLSFVALGTNQNIDNPNFVDTTDFVPQASTIVAPKIIGVEYDKNNNEREAITTIGAVKSTSE